MTDLDADVPADARLIEAFSLRVQEAALTGESVEVFKLARAWLRRRMSFPDVYSGSQSASQPSSADGGRVTD